MAAKPLPSQEVLRQLLDYDPATGGLRWKARGPEWFPPSGLTTAQNMNRWNSRHAGTDAVCKVTPKGYRGGRLFDRQVFAHRVAWKWMTGEDPDQIDHINGVRNDNRFVNLRAADNMINSRNRKRRLDNTSGVTGVHEATRNGSRTGWIVKVEGRYLGTFDCIGRAIAARREAERRHGFHENHGRAA